MNSTFMMRWEAAAAVAMVGGAVVARSCRVIQTLDPIKVDGDPGTSFLGLSRIGHLKLYCG